MPHKHHAPTCPYCGVQSSPTTGAEIYPRHRKLAKKRFFICRPCKAWVGCHDDGRPLGTPAAAELRIARKRAHDLFDRLWQGRFMTRNQAYSWLAETLGVDKHDAHIGQATLEQCRLITQAAAAQLNHLISTTKHPHK